MPQRLKKEKSEELTIKYGRDFTEAVEAYESIKSLLELMFPSPETNIKMMRSGSRGLDGTLENAEHHAQELLKFINLLRKHAARGFVTWKQGHNVHEFVNVDGTRYTLRPITDIQGNYSGIRLSLRLSKSEEHALFDATELEMIPMMLSMMRMLAVGQRGRIRGGVSVMQN